MSTQEFRSIVMPLQAIMYRIALRITGNHDDACDAIQDTLVRLWNHAGSLAVAQDKSAYCVGALKKQCISLMRSRKEHAPVEILACNPSPESLSDDVERRDTLRIIREAIGGLPESQRRVMELSVFSQCDNSEICDITGMTDANVRAALSRGRRRIKELFTQKSARL